MKKISAVLAFAFLFPGFSGSALAAYSYDYFFGTVFVPAVRNLSPSSSASVPASVSAPSSAAPTNSSTFSSQISSMQKSLSQMSLALAKLNSNLAKSKLSDGNTITNTPKMAVATGIPLLLEEKTQKKTDSKGSIFASLIPPNIRKSSLIVMPLVILTLGIFGIILYIFMRRQNRQRSLSSR